MISYDDVNVISQALSAELNKAMHTCAAGDMTVEAWNRMEATHKRIVAGLIATKSEMAKTKPKTVGLGLGQRHTTYHRECWQCSDKFITADQSRGWCIECINEQKGHSNDCI